MKFKLISRNWWRKNLFLLLSKISNKNNLSGAEIPQNPRSIMVLAPVLLGDYLILTPLYHAIKTNFPESEVIVVVKPPIKHLAERDPNVDRVIVYQNLPGWFGAMSRIRKVAAQVVIMPKPHSSVTEAILLFWSNSKIRIGLVSKGFESLLSHPVSHDDKKDHRVVTMLRLLEPLGINPVECDLGLIIGTNEEWEERAESFIRERFQNQSIIGINISAGSSSRIWQFEKWVGLIQKLNLNYPDLEFIIFSAPNDRLKGEQLADECPKTEYIPTKNLIEAGAYYSKVSAFISPDTAAVHTAVARKIPVAVLYNQDRVIYYRFKPLTGVSRAIFTPEGGRINQISVDAVFNKVVEIIIECKIGVEN